MNFRMLSAGLALGLFLLAGPARAAAPYEGKGMLSPSPNPSAPQANVPMTVPPIDPGTPMDTYGFGSVTTHDGRHAFSVEDGNNLGLLVPDLSGDYVLVPGGPRPSPNPDMVEAQELKLKARELAAQLLETWPNQSLSGLVALPTSFVSLDNFSQSSGLGRYLAEAMFYEFNTRGFATREYRMNGVINMTPGQGEFALSRALPDVKVSGRWGALLVGTYYRDRNAVFVNARLVRPADGLVLRTGQVILPMNNLIARMSAQPPFRSGSLRIVPGSGK